ncbi:MAG: RNA methyltransferase [Bacteroidales bacterium]|nr:RNA methyltransferase [Bacteroidales bacterium]
MKDEDPGFSILPDELYLALDSVKDPGNMGTILRIAEWFGIRAIIASKGSVELYNPKVVHSSMGSIFRMKVIYCDLEPFLAGIKGKTTVYGTYPQAPSIYSQKREKGALILMGGESDGISPDLGKYIERRVSIPPYSKESTNHPESLNVAVATALICSEFRRPSV